MENSTEENSNQEINPESNLPSTDPIDSELIQFSNSIMNLKSEIRKVIVGQDKVIDLMLAGLLSSGHVLIEGVPGIAKTLIAKLLAKTLSVDFSRIQFTPDLMPTDVTGTTVYNMQKSEFTFNKGPIFSNFVHIDEINRAPAKTQAALFEVMEERQISVDGTTHLLEFPFFVIATQNPIDILKRFSEDFSMASIDKVKPVLSAADLAGFKSIIEKIHIKDELIDYIAKISHATRNHGSIFLGASPRASLAILRSSKALAALSGRNFVTPDDIRRVANPVMNHRVILTPEKEMEGITTDDIIAEITQNIEVPR